MKALAINASPKKDKGHTAAILDRLLVGIQNAGAEADVLYTQELSIAPCLGEHSCWFGNPGTCVQKDDAGEVLARLAASDIWIFATPLYVDGMAGPMKNLLDRMLPLAEPTIDLRDGHCAWHTRARVKPGKVVLVSSCGFWEVDNFDPLVMHVKTVCRRMDREFAGALLRPHAGVFAAMANAAGACDVLEACKEAGVRLVQEGVIPDVIQEIVSRPLISLGEYVENANQAARAILSAKSGTIGR